jgi:hypothetical protein
VEEEDGGDMWELTRLGVGATGRVLWMAESRDPHQRCWSRRRNSMLEDREQGEVVAGMGQLVCQGLKDDGEWRGAAAWRRE